MDDDLPAITPDYLAMLNRRWDAMRPHIVRTALAEAGIDVSAIPRPPPAPPRPAVMAVRVPFKPYADPTTRPVSKHAERDRTIVAMVRQGTSRKAVAERYGMSLANIDRIIFNQGGVRP